MISSDESENSDYVPKRTSENKNKNKNTKNKKSKSEVENSESLSHGKEEVREMGGQSYSPIYEKSKSPDNSSSGRVESEIDSLRSSFQQQHHVLGEVRVGIERQNENIFDMTRYLDKINAEAAERRKSADKYLEEVRENTARFFANARIEAKARRIEAEQIKLESDQWKEDAALRSKFRDLKRSALQDVNDSQERELIESQLKWEEAKEQTVLRATRAREANYQDQNERKRKEFSTSARSSSIEETRGLKALLSGGEQVNTGKEEARGLRALLVLSGGVNTGKEEAPSQTDSEKEEDLDTRSGLLKEHKSLAEDVERLERRRAER